MLKLFLLYRNTIWFFETWPYAWKQKHICFIFSMFWRKPGILISDLYIYGMKIQTNIKQNSVKKIRREITNFSKCFFLLGWSRPTYFGLGRIMNSGDERWRSRRKRKRGARELTYGGSCEGSRWWLQVVAALRLRTGELIAVGWRFFFFFFSASLFYSFFLIPSSSLILLLFLWSLLLLAALLVVKWRWFQTVVLLLSLFQRGFLCMSLFLLFFHFSRCRCCYRQRGGRWQLAVALVVAMLTATGGSSSFLLCFSSFSSIFQIFSPCFRPPLFLPYVLFPLFYLSFASLFLQKNCPPCLSSSPLYL